MVLLATAGLHNMAGLAWVALLLMASFASAQLRLFSQKPCGDSSCNPYEYCREIDSICSQCSIVCDEKNHNVQPKICEDHCQDFLHDMRYQLKSEKETPRDDAAGLNGQVQRLQALATAALIISLILTCIILVIAGIWIKKKNLMPFLFKKDKNLKINDKARYVGETPISTIRLPKDTPTTITMPPIPDAVRSNNQVTPVDYPSHHHSNNMSTFKNPAPKKPETPSSTNKSLPGVIRVPSEDSTYAYDNPALTPSPTAVKSNNLT